MKSNGEKKRPRLTDPQPEAQEDMFLKASVGWFHVFNDMIHGGDLRRIMDECSSAVGVYLVVKSLVHYARGVSFPSIKTIGEKTGLSNATVHKALRVLQEYGYLEIEKRGRSNHYRIKEKIRVDNADGEEQAIISFDYFSTVLKDVRAEINDFLINQNTGRGTEEKYQYIHIENLNLTMYNQQNYGGENTQTNKTGVSFSEGLEDLEKTAIEADFQEGMSIGEAVVSHRHRLAKAKRKLDSDV